MGVKPLKFELVDGSDTPWNRCFQVATRKFDIAYREETVTTRGSALLGAWMASRAKPRTRLRASHGGMFLVIAVTLQGIIISCVKLNDDKYYLEWAHVTTVQTEVAWSHTSSYDRSSMRCLRLSSDSYTPSGAI